MATEVSSLTPANSPVSSKTKTKPIDEMDTKVNSTYSSPLPPCKICGAKASGLHYGVNTCEACKGFFRRAMKFQKKYKCFRQQNCDIIGGRSVRTSCPFCRLQKCLNMGMAHKAIKTGRYTHAKRTENIMEVKRLENVSKSFSFQPTGHGFNSHTNGGMDYWKRESIDIKKEPEEDASCHYQYTTPTTNSINTNNLFHPTDQNSFNHMTSSGTFHHMEDLIPCAPYGKLNETIPNFHTYYEDNKPPLKSGFSLPYHSQPMDFILGENQCQSPDSHLNLPVSPGGDGFNPQNNPPLDGVYISIPTPPLSSSSREDISPFCPSSSTSYFPYTNDNEPDNFSWADNKSERNDLLDTEMPDLSNNTYTQLLPLPSLGSIPSPSLSSSSLSSSTSSLFLEPAELPTLQSPTTFLLPPHSGLDPVTEVVKQIHTNNQDTVSSLVQSHRKHIITLAEYDNNFISTVQEQYVDKHQAKAEMFGITSPFVKDEVYTEIFSQTGLDVDGRHEMRLFAYRSVGYYLKSIISFAQCIPGFNCLCHEDQQNLIKVSSLEQWYLNAYFGINKDKSVILMPNLKVFTFSEFGSLLGDAFADKCFEIVPAFKKIFLTYEILVLWKVIILLSSDRGDLKEPEKVTRLQEAYLEVLSNLINSQAKPHLLSQIINLTVKLRDIDTAFPIIFDQDHTLGLNPENLFLPSSS